MLLPMAGIVVSLVLVSVQVLDKMMPRMTLRLFPAGLAFR